MGYRVPTPRVVQPHPGGRILRAFFYPLFVGTLGALPPYLPLSRHCPERRVSLHTNRTFASQDISGRGDILARDNRPAGRATESPVRSQIGGYCGRQWSAIYHTVPQVSVTGERSEYIKPRPAAVLFPGFPRSQVISRKRLVTPKVPYSILHHGGRKINGERELVYVCGGTYGGVRCRVTPAKCVLNR